MESLRLICRECVPLGPKTPVLVGNLLYHMISCRPRVPGVLCNGLEDASICGLYALLLQRRALCLLSSWKKGACPDFNYCVFLMLCCGTPYDVFPRRFDMH